MEIKPWTKLVGEEIKITKLKVHIEPIAFVQVEIIEP